MIRKILVMLCLTAGSVTAIAQKSYNEQVLDYIAKFKDLAMQEQQRTGIPASITLAQGIFETAAGSSELCTNASNHFGIKCKNTWTGETYTYTDDAKDECFRKYNSAVHSYRDHSDFLKGNKRYSSLFTLSPTDYASWAKGLKRCGYATNPAYAQKLIKFIEDYKLQEYTYTALGDNNNGDILLASADPKMIPRRQNVSTVVPGENIPTEDGYVAAGGAKDDDDLYVQKATQQEEKNTSGVTDYYVTSTKNGMKGFYAKKGDMLLEYAIKNKIRYAKLLEMNDLPDAPLEADMFIYLSRKAKAGQAFTHTVADGESMLQIAQEEGIMLQQLRAYNHLEKDEQPVPGAVLNLQAPSDKAPQIFTSTAADKNKNARYTKNYSTDDGYVTGGKKQDAPKQEAVIDEAEESVATTPANNSRRVNIADEKPVEEIIAEERPATTTSAVTNKKDESKMSALDKLKAHMDKTVYADNNKKFEPKSTRNYDEETTTAMAEPVEETVTTPARRNSASAAKQNKDEERAAFERRLQERKERGRETAKNKKDEIKPKAKAKAKSHTVKRGETLFEIAEKYDITVSQLQKMNKLGGSKKIQPGMKLKVAK